MSRRVSFLVMVLGLFLGLWAATQYTAHHFGHQLALGNRLGEVAGVPVYKPWAFIPWVIHTSSRFPRAFDGGFAFLLAGAFIPTLTVGLAKLRKPPKVKEIGQGRWGDSFDMQKAKLTKGRGVVVGRFGKKLLTYDGPEHQLVAGASQSGKGVGHVIPTLLTWEHSALVYDIKGELWERTAGYRAKLGHVAYFNPTRADSLRFNPLWEIRKGVSEVRDVQNLVEILVGPTDSDADDSFWDNSAEELLVGVILHVLYAEPDDKKHLGRVRELVMDLEATAKTMEQTRHVVGPDGSPQTHPEVAQVAKSIAGASERTRSSIRLTAQTYLKLWADPLICELTSTSDLTLGQLMSSEHPVSLYVQPPPSDADRLRSLVRIFFNQTGRALLEHLDKDNHGRHKRHRLLMLIDEFPSLGRMPFLAESLRKAAGYGVKCQLVCQSFNDIAAQYGPANTIIDNCHILVAFASADTVTQERISKMSGTVVEYRESFSRPAFLLGSGNHTKSLSEHLRPLLTPGDVRELPYDEQLVFVTGSKPFRVSKVRYFEDKHFKKKLLPEPKNQQFPGGVEFDFAGEVAKSILPLPKAEPPKTARPKPAPKPPASPKEQTVLPVAPKSEEPRPEDELDLAVAQAALLEAESTCQDGPAEHDVPEDEICL